MEGAESEDEFHPSNGFYEAPETPPPKEAPAVIPKKQPQLAKLVSALNSNVNADEDTDNAPTPTPANLKTLPMLDTKKPLLKKEESNMSIGTKGKMKTAGKAVIAAQSMVKNKKSTKAAQAMTRLTGTIFDSDDQVPAWLQTPVVSIVQLSDTITGTGKSLRPTIEGLMYWETLMCALLIAFGLSFSYILGRLGFSLTWILILLVLVGTAFSQNITAMKHTISVQTTKNLAVRRLESESETVEWFNKFLSRMWVQMEPVLSASLKETAESSLAPHTVPIFTLGSAAPRIESIRTIEKTSDDVHIMDWDLNLTPVDEDVFTTRDKELGAIKGSKIEIRIKMFRILISNIEFSGKLRVGLKFMTKYPHIKLVEYSFLEQPYINFKLRPLKGIDIMDTGLSSLVSGVLTTILSGYVEPNKNIFDMESFFEGSDSDVPVGVLKVTIFEAKDLKNVELGGVSDPYAKVFIGGEEVARTSEVSTTLSPYWGETYFVVIMKSTLDIPPDLGPTAKRPDELRIQIFDKNDTLSDKSMGFTDSLHLSKWVKLLESGSKSITKNSTNPSSNPPSAPLSPVSVPPTPSDMLGKAPFDPRRLTSADRNKLINEWGSPFPEESDVWKHVMHENGGKPKGEVRIDLSYYPLPKAEEPVDPNDGKVEEKELDAAALKAKEVAQAEAAKIKEEAAKAWAEAEAKLTTGIITIVVHQAKELPCAKTVSPVCGLSLSGLPRAPVSPSNHLGYTSAGNRTNNPVWDHTFTYFMADSDAASFVFEVRESKDGKFLGQVVVPVKDIVQKKSGDASADWFKLSGTSGKVRITFKWLPLDMENAHSNAEIVRKEPIGMLKVTVLEAKGVANVEAFRKSDPYAKLNLSRRLVGSTHVKDNTLDPVWNEIFYAVCYSRNETLRIDLFDSNKVKKDLSLGSIEFAVEELINPSSWDLTSSDQVDSTLKAKKKKSDQEIGAGEGQEADDETDDHEVNEDKDLKRQTWLLKQKTDGLKIVRKGNFLDVWAPIYITKSANIEDADKKDNEKGSRTLAAPPLLTASSTALNLVGAGGAKPGQRGHIHLEIEMLDVVQNFYVRPKTTEEIGALRKLRLDAMAVEMLKPAEEKTEAEEKSMKPMASYSDLLKGKDVETDVAHQMLVNYVDPPGIMKKFPAGIVRLRVHEAKGLAESHNYYAEFLIDDEVAGHTRVQRKQTNPVWDSSFDVFFKNCMKQKAKIQLRRGGDDLKRNPGSDPIVGVWNADLESIVGYRNMWVTLHPNGWEGEVGQMRISVGYAPIDMEADEDSSKNMGILYADIVDAVHLEAVDSGGTSDPYCVAYINDKAIHKTKVHKKQLSPTFNETFLVNVRSRLRSTVEIVVRDHNAIGKHTVLGTATIHLAKIAPDILYVALLPLEGARGGYIRLKLLFLPQVLDESAFDDDHNGVDTKEDGRLAKFTKGLGSSVLGGVTSSLESIGGKGEPKQQQGGMTAEALASSRNAPVRSFGEPIPEKYATTDTTAATRSISTSESLQALIEEKHRQQLYGTVVLTIDAARNLKAVDEGGKSDPYVKVVQLVHGKEKVLLKTRVIKKTLDPVWSNETVQIRVPPNTVRIIMKDKNLFSDSKPMGEIELDFTTLLLGKDKAAGPLSQFDVWLPLGMGGMGELHVVGIYKPEGGASGIASSASTIPMPPPLTTSMSRATSSSSLKPNEDEDDEHRDGRLSPASVASVASSQSSIVENGDGEPKKERKRIFSFIKKH
ncbi:hypothetical protein HDU97_004375 [Phlyctochytrium planicorne]|nr:hypothetical protein HDU97_004375 [Phlyctochytrium planicorne]